MERFFFIFSLIIGIFHSFLFSILVETKNFGEIKKYVTLHTLVILDIDDTLLLPVQTLGTDVWFRYRIKQNEAAGMAPRAAFERALSEWEAVRHLTKVKIVEEGSEKIVEDMQKNQIKVMGLTTQGLALATRTVQQLCSLGIDLAKSAPSKEDCYFINELGVLYRQGILFTSGTPKGQALLKFLDQIHYHPSHIVFINDKAQHLIDIEEALKGKKIEFIGLRYSYCDERIANFNPEIADTQWKSSSFEYILSDQEAEKCLKQSSRS